MGDLVARLVTMYSHRGDGLPTQYINPDGPEAAERIAELEAELEVYADTLCEFGKDNSGCGHYDDNICFGCRARAALGDSQ